MTKGQIEEEIGFILAQKLEILNSRIQREYWENSMYFY